MEIKKILQRKLTQVMKFNRILVDFDLVNIGINLLNSGREFSPGISSINGLVGGERFVGGIVYCGCDTSLLYFQFSLME